MQNIYFTVQPLNLWNIYLICFLSQQVTVLMKDQFRYNVARLVIENCWIQCYLLIYIILMNNATGSRLQKCCIDCCMIWLGTSAHPEVWNLTRMRQFELSGLILISEVVFNLMSGKMIYYERLKHSNKKISSCNYIGPLWDNFENGEQFCFPHSQGTFYRVTNDSLDWF